MRSRLPSRAALLAAAGLITVGFAPLAVDHGGQAQAAFPGQNGKLAFVRSLDIWVANADGSNPVQLTTAPGLDRSPRWSADGTRIAFASSRSGGSKMFVMNADGSDQRQLTFTSARDRTSAWSADGTQVLYDKEFSEIYAINADGSGGERKLADGLFPGTSPYGDKVAFTASAVGLITIKLDGSSRFQVTRGDADWSANWSPGGNRSRLHSSGDGGGQGHLWRSCKRSGHRPADEHAQPGGGRAGLVARRHEDRLPRVLAPARWLRLRDLHHEPRRERRDAGPERIRVVRRGQPGLAAAAAPSAGWRAGNPDCGSCPSWSGRRDERSQRARVSVGLLRRVRPRLECSLGGAADRGPRISRLDWCVFRSKPCVQRVNGRRKARWRIVRPGHVQAHRVSAGSRPRDELSFGDRVRLAMYSLVQPRCARCSAGATSQGGEACSLGRRLQRLADLHVPNDCGSRGDGTVPALREECGAQGTKPNPEN